MNTSRMFLDGAWVEAADGATREILNPANNQAIAVVADGGEAEAASAIECARRAFDEGPWPQMRARERASYLFKLADLIEKNADALAELETRNNGKPLREAKYDVADAAGCFRYYAGLITKPLGQTYEVSDPTIQGMVVREPIGVCGQIIPWNYPLLMAAWKLAPGLAAGNCCILKPAETTPLTAIELFKLIAEAGFPPGAAQLLLGPGPTAGHALAASMARGQGRLHRRHGDGPQDHGGGDGQHQKGDAGTRREIAVHRFCGCGFRGRARVRDVRDFRRTGRSVQRRLAAHSRTERSRTNFSRAWPRRAAKIVVGDGLASENGDGPAHHAASTWSRCSATSTSGRAEGAESLCGGERLTDGALAAGISSRRPSSRRRAAGHDASCARKSSARCWWCSFSIPRRKPCAWRMTRSTDSRAAFSPAIRARACACCGNCAPESRG